MRAGAEAECLWRVLSLGLGSSSRGRAPFVRRWRGLALNADLNNVDGRSDLVARKKGPLGRDPRGGGVGVATVPAAVVPAARGLPQWVRAPRRR